MSYIGLQHRAKVVYLIPACSSFEAMSSSPTAGLAYPQECDSKRIEAISVYQPRMATQIGRFKVRLYHLIFLVVYALIGAQVFATIGEPYRRFLEKADREGFQGKNERESERAEDKSPF